MHKDNGDYGTRLLEICKSLVIMNGMLLDTCKNLMLCIMNGMCDIDRYTGKSTTIERSVIDYVMGSPYTSAKMNDFMHMILILSTLTSIAM